ncbi:3509_t:CDS:2 [Funneliformis geosporum]|uniref:Proline dehydrogenase n=1 Tax=Funneliformis geosporum TaxID=1117311 RepID=A0A9W4WLQ8_9GLOM|nr:12262_t:CDS:2 [Funneliformis geosporum]CAI2163792.1 3509_t:CDS:2 [Funneliformis geosporum]
MTNRFSAKLFTKLQTLRTNRYFSYETFQHIQRLKLRALQPVRFTSTSSKVSYYFHESSKVSQLMESTSTIDDIFSEDNRIAVQNKSIKALIHSLIVYRLCSFQWLVNRAPGLISFGEKAGLSAPIYWIIKHTFFAQFCGGETAKECIDTMSQLKTHGIGLILDLSIEADINENGSSSLNESRNNEADHVYRAMAKCITTAASHPNNFVALKLTGLSNPTILRNWTLTLNSLSKSFDKFDINKDGKLEKSDFLKFVYELFGNDKAYVARIFDHADVNKDGLIDKVEFINMLSLDNKSSRSLLVCNEELCEIARKKNVQLMIDAEQTYFQPAIDDVAMKLSTKYNKSDNKNGPIIFNTYQMYLKDSTERLIQNYNLSNRKQFVFAAKIVRGAYMISERKRAKEMGYPDPIHDNIENTHAAYDCAVEFLLNKLSEAQRTLDKPLDISNSPVVFMVASHNKKSIIKALRQMMDLDISTKSGLILFGQLLGMCDTITYTLGKSECGVYKYVPYGKVNEIIPYLIRRVQENSSIFEGVKEEGQCLWREIINRIFHMQSLISNS